MSLISELHTFFNTCHTNARPDERVDVETARALTIGYVLHYNQDGYKTRAVEQAFDLPIINPHTNQPTDSRYSGIIDCLLEKDGKLWFCDHKTVSKVDDKYWYELQTNAQLSQYILASLQMGLKVEGFLWDVIVKPGIRPKDLTKAAKKELETGSYCGIPCAYQGEDHETPTMYGIRLMADINEHPDKYFLRRPIYRPADELLHYALELYNWSEYEKRLRVDESLQNRNLGACKSFNTLCEYHQLCSKVESLGSGNRYCKRDESKRHNTAIKSGSLSPSRLSCLQLCPMKYTYKYVKKIELNTPEYNEYTALGGMVHKGLEVFLNTRMVDPIDFSKLCEGQ